MLTLKFRYDKNTNVQIDNYSIDNIDIIFSFNDNKYLRYLYRFRPYFKEVNFDYNIFSIKCTARDGSAFIAGYREDTYYAIRKKKKKKQILFVKNNSNMSTYKIGEAGVKALCLINDNFTDDEKILNDFLEKKVPKPFDEEKYFNSLDEGEKQEYLDDKKVDKFVREVSKINNLTDEQENNLFFYIKYMENKFLRNELLSNEYDISKFVIPESINNSEEQEKIDYSHTYKNEDLVYEIPDKYIFREDNFEEIALDYDDKYNYINELYSFFLYKYEKNKDCYINSINKVKSTIDELLPYFNDFLKITKEK